MLYRVVDYSDEEVRPGIRASRPPKTIMPMGIRRIEPKDESQRLAEYAEEKGRGAGDDDPASAARKQAAREGDEDDDDDSDSMFVDQGPGAKGEDDATIRIKQEAGEGMDIDQLPAAAAALAINGGGYKAPDSPERKEKVIVGADDEGKKLKKMRAGYKDPEQELIFEDLERLANMFNIDDEAAGAGEGSALEGHMFLFQFPPVLPPLKVTAVDGNGGGSGTKSPVKPEPVDDDDDVVMSSHPPTRSGGAAIDLTAVKDEEGENDDGDKATAEDDGGIEEGGYVGELVVRKSGKVELSWGGKVMEMVPGTQANFLSTAVLLEEADVKPAVAGALAGQQLPVIAGKAFGMGKIQGSFALAPAWEEEEEWVVDPQELVEAGVGRVGGGGEDGDGDNGDDDRL